MRYILDVPANFGTLAISEDGCLVGFLLAAFDNMIPDGYNIYNRVTNIIE